MKRNDRFSPVRRKLLGTIAIGTVATGFLVSNRAVAKGLPIHVWKSPTCGCCVDWVTHLEENGFAPIVHDDGNAEARKRLGMPVKYGSCHTAEINGYAIEGHVPAKEIYRLLDERPDAIGLSVPAMPRGTPGMDGPIYGGIVDPYDVLLIGPDGEASVFQSYRD